MIEPPPLPDEIVEGLRQINDSGEVHQWVMGDFLEEVVTELLPHYQHFFDDNGAKRAVKRARAWLINHLSNRTGIEKSTLRDRQNMAKFYPPEVRKQYDALTFHQLRACKSAGDCWQEWAIWALDNLPAPPHLIRAMIKYNGHLPPIWIGRWERMQSLCELMINDEAAPRHVREAAHSFLGEMVTEDQE